MQQPLVQTGPGGDFRTAFVIEHPGNRGRTPRLVAQAGHDLRIDKQVLPLPTAILKAPRTLLDRLFGIVRPIPAVKETSIRTPHLDKDQMQNESHPKAASHRAVDSRKSPDQRLFADDAGAGRSHRRQQGDGLRTRRGAHSQGSPCKRSTSNI